MPPKISKQLSPQDTFNFYQWIVAKWETCKDKQSYIYIDNKMCIGTWITLKIQGAAEFFDLGNDEPHIHQSRPLGDTLELLIRLRSRFVNLMPKSRILVVWCCLNETNCYFIHKQNADAQSSSDLRRSSMNDWYRSLIPCAYVKQLETVFHLETNIGRLKLIRRLLRRLLMETSQETPQET